MSIVSTLFGNSDPFIALANLCPVLSVPIDWKETPEVHIFLADLPGLTKDDVNVEVDDNRVLQISGEWKVPEDDKTEKWLRVERRRGKFSRRFRLPENAKADEVKASMVNGVLTVTVAKQEVKKKPEKKVIEIEEIIKS